MATYHPQIVHFAIALVFAGVFLRLVSLSGRLMFTGSAATALVVAGTLACFLAVASGTDAHGPVERIPGAREAVADHERWGEWARNVFVGVSVFELVALTLRKHRRGRMAAIAAALAGLLGLVVMYGASERGGRLVYGYAGGVGTRSGDPEDVNRVFIAGAYQQAVQDRDQGRGAQGAALIDLAAARFPANIDLQLTAVEWTTEIKKDPTGALQRLETLTIPAEDDRLRIRAGLARAGALAAQGNTDGAKAVLRTLQGEFPQSVQIKRRLDQLAGNTR
jgi:uncharacterized membrane protein